MFIFGRKRAIRNTSLMASVANFAEGVEIVLLMIIFANGCSAAWDVTRTSQRTLSPLILRRAQWVSSLL